MRRPVDAAGLRRFLAALGREARDERRVYLVGGATAVLFGWRDSTVDVDLKIVPDDDRLLRAIPRLKEELEINVELASPDGFIPEVPGWESRSPFVTREGSLSFHHYDPYSQALAKLERGHAKDLLDVKAMKERGLVQVERLLSYFEEIEPNLYRFPAIDPKAFRRAVEAFVGRE
ncbi:MAG TPA: DUF6036 family nucleotidyltransferase [Thermoanaerobaculia bacterium]|jgi:hypothetical protein|nr:DUF6036 family nucleotidyltransferase [Thermoanaerobaculia bacterium]